MNRTVRLICVGCLAIGGTWAALAGGNPAPGDTTRMVSLSSAGSPGNADSGEGTAVSERPIAVSSDGRRIVFISDATDLTPSGVVDYSFHASGDDDNAFVRFINANGTESTICLTIDLDDRAMGQALQVEISDNGRWAAVATNFYFGDPNQPECTGISPCYVYGEFGSTNTTNVVVYDLNASGGPTRACGTCDLYSGAPNMACIEPSFCSDGTLLAFSAFHNGGSQAGAIRVAYRPMNTSTSPPTFGTACELKQLNSSLYLGTAHPKVSGDCAHIAFVADSDPNGAGYPATQVLRYTLGSSCSGTYALVSEVSGSPANAAAGILPWAGTATALMNDEDLDISTNGNIVAFGSVATNLVNGSPSGYHHIYQRNMTSGAVIGVSTTAAGAWADRDSYDCSISGNGNCIAFVTYATNFPSANGNEHAYLKFNGGANLRTLDLRAGTVGNSHARSVVLSLAGTHAAFASASTNLRVPNDPSPNYWDVFVRGAFPVIN